MGPQDGWVVGEAIMENGTLNGTLAFYPYESLLGHPIDVGQLRVPVRKPTSPTGRRTWQPKRVGSGSDLRK
jgi:hypothetical protein